MYWQRSLLFCSGLRHHRNCRLLLSGHWHGPLLQPAEKHYLNGWLFLIVRGDADVAPQGILVKGVPDPGLDLVFLTFDNRHHVELHVRGVCLRLQDFKGRRRIGFKGYHFLSSLAFLKKTEGKGSRRHRYLTDNFTEYADVHIFQRLVIGGHHDNIPELADFHIRKHGYLNSLVLAVVVAVRTGLNLYLIAPRCCRNDFCLILIFTRYGYIAHRSFALLEAAEINNVWLQGKHHLDVCNQIQLYRLL